MDRVNIVYTFRQCAEFIINKCLNLWPTAVVLVFAMFRVMHVGVDN